MLPLFIRGERSSTSVTEFGVQVPTVGDTPKNKKPHSISRVGFIRLQHDIFKSYPSSFDTCQCAAVVDVEATAFDENDVRLIFIPI